jgi:iron-sulfur cluster repair protein YtfE (RIC family)
LERIEQAKKEMPLIFDNPDLTRRDNWLQHPNWRKNSQMPPFHVHFRQEVQQSIRYLYQCLVSLSENKKIRAANSASQAYGAFRGCMSGLNGHVSIEEYAVFPQFQKRFPSVDIHFLYQEHQKLHDKEAKTKKTLEKLSDSLKGNAGEDVSSYTALDALQELLDFDQDLMAHLGEEEEFIVPMTLSTDRLVY